MHGYFGLCITGNTQDGTHKSRLVACRRFTGSHTAENIATMFSNLLHEVDVESKVTGVVTDNASNMRKAFRRDELAGASNQPTLQLENIAGSDEDDEFVRVAIDWDSVDEESTSLLPPRYGCFAHTLQLIVKDGLAEATTKISNLLQKCSALVAAVHRSCKVTELLEEKHVAQIHSPNATRWNSKYEMIKGILEAEKKCEGILKQLQM